MSEHRATIEWATSASSEDFLKGHYSRAHRWMFDGGIAVDASPSPAVVRAPWSKPEYVDPEEAFVASISSCHMLTFLFIAAKSGFTVTHYRDEAVGVMTKTAEGKVWISRVTLAPKISYADGHAPTAAELERLHHTAHEQCFISNSVKTEIVIT